MPLFVRIEGPGLTSLVELPVPVPGEHEFLVKNVAAAQNPTDWQSVHDWYHKPGGILGCDYAGIVESVGPGVTRFKKGDRVAGLVFGNLKDDKHGAFGEYVLGHQDKAVHIPDTMVFDDAATLGVALMSVGQSFYTSESLQLPPPHGKPAKSFCVLVFGGSTAVGSMAIQFAKISGATIVATASPHNFEFVYSMGADKVFDRLDPSLARKIRSYTSESLELALDTIALPETVQLIEECIGKSGGHIHTLLRPPPGRHRKDIKFTYATGYSVWGERYSMRSGEVEASDLQKQASTTFFSVADDLLNKGLVKTHNVKIMPGGLGGVAEGLLLQKNGGLSAEKLVYRIGDTPELQNASRGWLGFLWRYFVR